jgi:ferrous iron transport protein B
MRASVTGGGSLGGSGVVSVGGTVSGELSTVIALVGSPNSGKTTLFNWLTGARSKTVNYPGSTVDYSVGETHPRMHVSASDQPLTIMDTPGTYSLDPKSPDEKVTTEAIFAHPTFGAARLVISVVDATHLSRHLLVTKQLIKAGFNVVLAVTMRDLLREHDEDLDVDLLSRELGVPVVLIDGRLGSGVRELLASARSELGRINVTDFRQDRASRPLSPWSEEEVETTLREVIRLSDRARVALDKRPGDSEEYKTARARTRRLDQVLLHPFWGLILFLSLMSILFSSIFWLAQPLMDLVDQLLSGLAGGVLAWAPESLFAQFVSGGVIASVSSVLIFVPQIFILFVGIIFLEDSGYLARSATLVDKPLSLFGLGGRSFVPLLSGYACAVPAMMAARTINSRRERLLTLLVIPLMSCSARLPVFALLLSFLFHADAAWKGGVALTGIYVLSLVLGAIAAIVVGRFLTLQKDERSFFMLELPVYRRPRLTLVLRQAFWRTRSYVLRAGPAIFLFALIVWIGTTFPNYHLEDKSERLKTSFAAEIGQMIEPVFTPMGGDWRTGVGLISAFAAREVFVSSLAVVFQVTDDNEESMQSTLLSKMHDAKAPDGQPLFTLASVMGLIVFFMIALQCLSTVVVAIRESGGLKFALLQLLGFNIAGYTLAVLLVQGLRALGVD